jgi:hypothetical protein
MLLLSIAAVRRAAHSQRLQQQAVTKSPALELIPKCSTFCSPTTLAIASQTRIQMHQLTSTPVNLTQGLRRESNSTHRCFHHSLIRQSAVECSTLLSRRHATRLPFLQLVNTCVAERHAPLSRGKPCTPGCPHALPWRRHPWEHTATLQP